MHDPIISTTIFFGLFFAAISALQFLSNKISFPYTVILLIFGLVTQYASRHIGIETHLSLGPDFIFYILLPLLLFDSAMRMSFHQFKLHFKTLTFVTTFGLLISMFVVGALTAIFVGIPFKIALLFGAIISATDPIAVVSIFKSLRAPKRLALLAEGESMFNDATAVIAFRTLSASVAGATALGSVELILNFGSFIYVFAGSIVVGAAFGYVATKIIKSVVDDHIIETTITVALALGVFIITEHFLHLSGVIATVMAGIVLGNIGRTSISRGVVHFIDNLWEYVGFLSVSLVFFFSTYSLDISFFFHKPMHLLLVVLGTLIARAVSVYISFAITNKTPFFKREPNVPTSWQHVLNWGGLRGVIPLVLVYSLPDDFIYKNDFVNFTMATFLFTLFVNGTTIKKVLIMLGVNIPKKEQEIIKEEERLFEIEESRHRLEEVELGDVSRRAKKRIEKSLEMEEVRHKEILSEITTPTEFLRSLRYEALEIERDKLNNLFEDGLIDESVYFAFETQLDLQFDALEFPEVSKGRAIANGGLTESESSFQKSIKRAEYLENNLQLFSKITGVSKNRLAKNRMAFLRARIISSQEVLLYLDRLRKLFKADKSALLSIEKVKREQEKYIERNRLQVNSLTKGYPIAAEYYQEEYLSRIAGIR